MKRGVINFTAQEIGLMGQVLASSTLTPGQNLLARLQLTQGQASGIQVSNDEVETVLDLLPPPTPNPNSQVANELRQKLGEFTAG